MLTLYVYLSFMIELVVFVSFFMLLSFANGAFRLVMVYSRSGFSYGWLDWQTGSTFMISLELLSHPQQQLGLYSCLLYTSDAADE